MIIFEKKGIQPQASLTAIYLGRGKWEYKHEFYTVRALAVHLWASLRQSYAFFLEEVEAMFSWQFYPSLQRGAIAFGGNSTNSTITSSGSNIMIVAGIFNTANDIGTVTFNSVNMNQVDTDSSFGVSRPCRTYMLKNQAATSGLSGVGASNYTVYYYTGVAQNDTAGTVDNHAVTLGNSTAPSGSITPVASSCWVWCTINVNNQTATTSAFTNMANHTGQATPSSATLDSGDSGGAAGAQTQSETASASGLWSVFQISMAPVAAAGPANLKSFDTNVKANIKSINTNPIANIKSLDTNV